MRQLAPVGGTKKPVYLEDCPEFRDWVNCFLELRGMHRFKDDPEWGNRLQKFRNGTVDLSDIAAINARVVTDPSNNLTLPPDVKYATYYNRDRDAINAALFEERCKSLYGTTGNTNDSVMVFSSNLEVQNSTKTYVPFRNCRAFWENCTEHNLDLSRAGRLDPVLRLYRGCHVMIPCNIDVKRGLANGTQATFQKIVLKTNETPRVILLDGNVPVRAVYANQVSHIVLRHCNGRIQPTSFHIQPKRHSFKANMLKPEVLRIANDKYDTLQMRGIQLPVVVNNATTGHKLQGSGVDTLFVHNWNYTTNWPYVILSRVKTISGLFLRTKLTDDLTEYTMPSALTTMLEKFRAKVPTYYTLQQYTQLQQE
jgi:hypothetical protein